jgi:two-component system chemotaxis response regulator CheB
VVIDDYALAAFPHLDRGLAEAGALVMRSFRGLPNPQLLRRFPGYRGAAVVGGSDRRSLLERLETATATLAAPVVAALPRGVLPGAELRGPGVVDLLPAGTPGAAERILLMAQVPIVSGGGRAPARRAGTTSESRPPRARLDPHPAATPGGAELPDRIVAVASSTGGVWVLAEVLRQLAGRGRHAVLLAQHMEADFVPFFADWLATISSLRPALVGDPRAIEPGVVYLPRGGADLVVEGTRVTAASASSRFVPSADRLMRSAARHLGARCAGLVLSGMGSDGSEGLREVAAAGGRAVCQLPASAAVPSMPENALRRAPGAAAVAPEALADAVLGG